MNYKKIKVDLIGTGGHSRVLIDICKSLNIKIENLYENGLKILEKNKKIEDIPILEFEKNVELKNKNILLAIGDLYERSKLFNKYLIQNKLLNLAHQQALISANLIQKLGNIICKGVIIGPNVILGNNNLINTGAIIDHEVIINDNCNIGPGSKIGGRTKIENNVNIGIGVTIIDKITIGNDVIVGAGSVVIDNLLPNSTYVGVPAKKIK